MLLLLAQLVAPPLQDGPVRLPGPPASWSDRPSPNRSRPPPSTPGPWKHRSPSPAASGRYPPPLTPLPRHRPPSSGAAAGDPRTDALQPPPGARDPGRVQPHRRSPGTAQGLRRSPQYPAGLRWVRQQPRLRGERPHPGIPECGGGDCRWDPGVRQRSPVEPSCRATAGPPAGSDPAVINGGDAVAAPEAAARHQECPGDPGAAG